MKVTFLGTGTSTGVPQMGCSCEVCRSNDPRDTRLRTSALLTTDSGRNILVDCGPDFRQQFLAHSDALSRIDGILFTHEHFDHASGLNEIRPLHSAQLYAEKRVAEAIRYNLPYIFSEHPYPGAPTLDLHVINPDEPFFIDGQEVIPVRAIHGQLPVLGYRIGSFGYLTDISEIEDGELSKFKGVKVFVLGALRYKPHPSHLSVEESIEVARRVGAEKTFFVHMSHDIGLHAEVCASLPEGMTLAYDALTYEW